MLQTINYKLITTPQVTKPGYWNYINVSVIEESSKKEVYNFIRNYSSINDATWVPFVVNNKQYAFVGHKYNSLEIIDLDTKEIIIAKDWHRDICPVELKEFTPGVFLLNYVVWACPGSCLGFVDAREIDKGIIKYNLYPKIFNNIEYRNISLKNSCLLYLQEDNKWIGSIEYTVNESIEFVNLDMELSKHAN